MGKIKTIRKKESTKNDPNPYQTYPIMTSQILLSTAIIVIMFSLFYIRTKRLLNKNLDILKKDNDSTFFYIKKMESRLAKPIEDFNTNGEQVHNHKPEREITYNNKQVKILNSFCGCFFMLRPETIKAIGYPPIAEGTNDAAYEDWFYTRQIQVRNWKAAALIKGTNQGYDKSIREEKEKLNNNI